MFGYNTQDLKNIPLFQKVIFLGVVLSIIIGSFMYLVFLPKKSEIKALEVANSKLNDDINVNRIKIRRLDALKKENQELLKELNKRKAQLPSEGEVATLLKQVSDLGVGTGLDIKLWRPGPSKRNPSGLFVSLPVNVEVSGGFHSVAMFFDRINKLPRIVTISDIKMSNGKEDASGMKIQTKFVATAFAAVSKPSPKKK